MAEYPAQLVGREGDDQLLLVPAETLFGLEDALMPDAIADLGHELGVTARPLPGLGDDPRATVFTADVALDITDVANLLTTDHGYRFITPLYRVDQAEDDGRRFPACPGTVIMRFRDTVPPADRDQILRENVTDRYPEFSLVDNDYGVDTVVFSTVGEGRPIGEPSAAMELASNLMARAEVIHAEVDWLAINPHMQAQPQGNLAAIGAPVAGIDGTGATIAVLDGGFAASHPGLLLLPLFDAVNDPAPAAQLLMAHGTLCAGVIGGFRKTSMNAATTYIGLAPRSNLQPVRVFSELQTVAAHVRHLAIGINLAVAQGVDAISISLAGYPPSAILTDAVEAAEVAGIPIAAGSGNARPAPMQNVGVEPPSVHCKVQYPAAYKTVIAVGAVTTAATGVIERIGFTNWPHPPGAEWASNFGERLDVVAPGVEVPSTDLPGGQGEAPGDYFKAFLGTSAATPHVAALAGLLKRNDPSLSAVKIRDMIFSTCRLAGYAPSPGIADWPWNPEVGYGIIDVPMALLRSTPEQDEPVDEGLPYGGTQQRRTKGKRGAAMATTYKCNDGNVPAAKAYTGQFAKCHRPLADFLERLKEADNHEMLTDFWNDRYDTAKNAGLPWQACIMLGTGDLDEIARAVSIELSSDPRSAADLIGPIWVRGK